MSNRNLLILGLVAAGIVALAVVTSRTTNKPITTSTAPSYLIQGLDPEKISKITISTGKEGELVALTRKGANFVVANKDNYPAIASEINKLITTCLDIQTAEMYTDNPANFKDLGVTEEDARIAVKFYKTGSSLLTGVIVGKQREQTKGSGYIRRVEDNKVYVLAAQVPWIKKRPTDYIDQGLTNVKREDIDSIMVSGPNETYVLKPGLGDKGVELENMPEGKVLKNKGAVANAVFTALVNLKFDDVNAEASVERLKFDKKYVCRLKDSTAYTFWLAKDGNDWFAKCDAKFLDSAPVTKTQGEVETQEELKKKEAKLLARDAADEFLEKHKGWVYQIPSFNAENLTKPLTELLEDAAKEGQTPGEPNEALLRQGYAGQAVDANLTETADK